MLKISQNVRNEKFDQLVRTKAYSFIDFIIPIQGRIEECKRFLRNIQKVLFESKNLKIHLTFVYFQMDEYIDQYLKLKDELTKLLSAMSTVSGKSEI